MSPLSEIRRKNLKLLVSQMGMESASEALGKPVSQLRDMIAGRKAFGEKVARQLEQRYAPERPAGWLDAENPDNPPQTHSTLVQDISEAVLLLGKLTDDERAGFMHQLRTGALTHSSNSNNAPLHMVHESKSNTYAWNTPDNSAEHLGTQPMLTGSEKSEIEAKKKAADCAQRPVGKL